MKLCRYGKDGFEKPGIIDHEGKLRDLSKVVASIGPGTVDTPSLGERINAFADPVQARKDFIARQPMGRLGTVDDITGILVFLASDESRFATGNMYSIDGGMTI